MASRRISHRVALSLAAASFCFFCIPAALAAGADDPIADPPPSVMLCAVVDSLPTDPTEITETTEFVDPTETAVDDSTGPSCWYEPIPVDHCWNWRGIHIDPPIIDPPTIDPPTIDGPDTTEPTTDTTDTTDTTEPTTDTTDTTISDSTDPTESTILAPVDPRPFWFCYSEPHSPTDAPIGSSDDGVLVITALDPSVLPADDSITDLRITIHGSGFSSVTSVTVGDVDCLPIEIIDESTLTCAPQVTGIGSYDVVLTDSDGRTATAAAALDYLEPAAFWARSIYAYTDDPLLRSVTVTSTTAPRSATESALGEPAVPAFTG